MTEKTFWARVVTLFIVFAIANLFFSFLAFISFLLAYSALSLMTATIVWLAIIFYFRHDLVTFQRFHLLIGAVSGLIPALYFWSLVFAYDNQDISEKVASAFYLLPIIVLPPVILSILSAAIAVKITLTSRADHSA